MTIPLVDLKAQYLSMKKELDEAIAGVIGSSQFILGKEVSSFEEEFAAFCHTKYAVGVSSGTSALRLALSALEVGPGDEVITTPHTFIATAEAISHVGAMPVFVDIEPDSYNIDPAKVERAINTKTKAVIPVHLYGQPAEMEPIMQIARKHGLKVIEDAAQAHGAEYKGHRVGSIGDAACFSFFPAKNLGAYGDGGMVVTADEQIAERVRLLRNHGRSTKYEHLEIGYNERLDTLQAAILRVGLRKLEEWNRQRRQNAATYRELLGGLDLILPTEKEHLKSVYHLFVARTKRRDGLQKYLSSKGIETGIHYPIPLHLQPSYRHLGYRRGDFPFAEQAAEEVLSLPMYPQLSSEQVAEVSRAIAEFFGQC